MEPHSTRTKWACARMYGAIILLGCAPFLGCGQREADDRATAVPEVTVTTVQKGPIDQALLVSGNLAAVPNHDAKVAALVPGRIKSVLVNEGDRVNAGQKLAELEQIPFADQLRQAEAAVAQAQANLQNAKLAAARNETLLQRGIAAGKEVEDARTQVSVDEAALHQAEAAESAARTQLDRTLLRSPFAGTIVHRFLSAGEQVDGGGAQAVVEVADIDTLELLGSVPASRLAAIRNGDEFSFHIDAFPNTTFKARIVRVFPAVDPATNNGTIRIRIDNPNHLAKLGMFVTLDLPLQEKAQRLIVPRQAIYPDETGEPRVYKVSAGEAEAVAVKLGIQTKDTAEILSGVQQGDTIILSGGYGLPEKAKVHVKP